MACCYVAPRRYDYVVLLEEIIACYLFCYVVDIRFHDFLMSLTTLVFRLNHYDDYDNADVAYFLFESSSRNLSAQSSNRKIGK